MSRELLNGHHFTDIILLWARLQNDMCYQEIYELHDDFSQTD